MATAVRTVSLTANVLGMRARAAANHGIYIYEQAVMASLPLYRPRRQAKPTTSVQERKQACRN